MRFGDFCVDYRDLNQLISNDRFLIPTDDELIDELRGSRYFSKLYVKSIYHQVRINKGNNNKTAFRTHKDYINFLGMLSGLTKALATFQPLMNQLFIPFLRKFVNVFFVDIYYIFFVWFSFYF